MNRRSLFRLSTAAALTAGLPIAAAGARAAPASPLRPPAAGPITVAFLLSRNAQVIDFAGPWEVFTAVGIPGQPQQNAFQLYTVGATRDPIKATGGMTITPDYTFATAPPPNLIVIPAQGNHSDTVLAWIRDASVGADLTMSVCAGAFILAKTGLLSGKAATTHHGNFTEFAMQFPDIALQRGARFVEDGKFATSGGLSSGIDLALRVVERYFGRAVARNTAYTLEYQGLGWLDPRSNQAYAKRPRGTAAHPLCPVCDMAVEKATAPSSIFRRRTYYFCMDAHKNSFDAAPMPFLA
ncbi:DJ-1/PfpI family protein [Massilia sp. S19_KUP03_FR1]|uniref:DJ-1/PfpI family protein n=1 Tax=Massilia sp. S19_KUP03_FR1 TaxID=3025503 RepID=UPI002FCD1D6E